MKPVKSSGQYTNWNSLISEESNLNYSKKTTNSTNSTTAVKEHVKSNLTLQESGSWDSIVHEFEYYAEGIENLQNIQVRRLSALKLAQLCHNSDSQFVLRAKGALARCFHILETNGQTDDQLFLLCLLSIAVLLSKVKENIDYFTPVIVKLLLRAFSQMELSETDFPQVINRVDAVEKKKEKLALKRGKRDKGKNFIGVDIMAQLQQLFEDDDILRSVIQDRNIHAYDLSIVALYRALLVEDEVSNAPTVSSGKSMATGSTKRLKQFIRMNCGLDMIVDFVKKVVQLKNCFCNWHLLFSLKILEQCSFLDEQNQEHLAHTVLIESILQIIDGISRSIWRQDNVYLIEASKRDMRVELLLACIRVIINVTHSNPIACEKLGNVQGVRILFGLFIIIWKFPEKLIDKNGGENQDKKLDFDIKLLLLSAIVNCIESNTTNRRLLSSFNVSVFYSSMNISDDESGDTQLVSFNQTKNDSVVDNENKTTDRCSDHTCTCLVRFFNEKIESYTDHLISEKGESNVYSADDWSVEDLILAGSTSLVLGYLMREDGYCTALVLGALANGSPQPIIRVLEAYVALHSQVGALTDQMLREVLQVINELKKYLPDSHVDKSDISESINCIDKRQLSKKSHLGLPFNQSPSCSGSPPPAAFQLKQRPWMRDDVCISDMEFKEELKLDTNSIDKEINKFKKENDECFSPDSGIADVCQDTNQQNEVPSRKEDGLPPTIEKKMRQLPSESKKENTVNRSIKRDLNYSLENDQVLCSSSGASSNNRNSARCLGKRRKKGNAESRSKSMMGSEVRLTSSVFDFDG